MSKIWLEVVARSNSHTTLQDKDDLKDDTHRRLQVEVHTKSSKSRPSIEKKSTFCQNFPLEDLEFSKVFHTFATSKDIHIHTHSHIHPHNRVFFEHDEIFINNKGRVQ